MPAEVNQLKALTNVHGEIGLDYGKDVMSKKRKQ